MVNITKYDEGFTIKIDGISNEIRIIINMFGSVINIEDVTIVKYKKKKITELTYKEHKNKILIYAKEYKKPIIKITESEVII